METTPLFSLVHLLTVQATSHKQHAQVVFDPTAARAAQGMLCRRLATELIDMHDSAEANDFDAKPLDVDKVTEYIAGIGSVHFPQNARALLLALLDE